MPNEREGKLIQPNVISQWKNKLNLKIQNIFSNNNEVEEIIKKVNKICIGSSTGGWRKGTKE